MCMKKLSLMALAAAGMLAVGCADKDVVEQAANSDYNLVPGQNSWLAVGIALPDDGTTTRANEDLVDGEASEFEVRSAMLVLFKGGTEANATYFGQYPLTVASDDFSKETGDNVPGGNQEGTNADGFGEITTTSKRYVTQITNPNLGSEDKLWAYVILNYSGNNTSIAYSGTFADFSKQKLTAIGINNEVAGQGVIGENGLVMTSVPIASAAGGTKAPDAAKVTTLSEVQRDAIFETKVEAEKTDNPLTCCYVERAAVKVELKNSVMTLDGTSIPFAVTNWALGNVNNNASGYYNTRQFNTDWLGYANNQAPANTRYRMVGRTGFWNTGTHTPTGYRTYFGEDVNFDGNTGLIKTTLADDDDYIAFSTGTGAKNVLYTYENTIDENSMIYQNTTYVGVKATVGDGSDFWVEEGQPTTKLDNAAAIGNRVKANASSTFDTAVGTIEDAITADLSAEAPATSAIKTAAGNNDIKRVSFDLDAEITPVSVTAATGEQTYTYKIVMKNIVAKDASNADIVLADKQAAMEAAVRGLTKVASVLSESRTNPTKFYKHANGVSYYTMRIAHFGGNDVAGGDSGDKDFANGETPWSAPGLAYNVYDKIYPMNGQSLHETPINYGTSRAAAWLGRWSIVRNNWYVLDIKQVKGLGSPVPVDYSGTGTGVGPTPDDNPGREYYIAAEIHILPWAKRYQSVKF